MYRITRIAFAAASALIISACATSAWQQPSNHPADPGAEPGVVPAISSLDRYRDRAKPVAVPEETPPMDETDHSMHDGHGETQP